MLYEVITETGVFETLQGALGGAPGAGDATAQFGEVGATLIV